MRQILSLLVLVVLVTLLQVSFTSPYFSDQAVITGNSLSTANYAVSPSPSPSPSPTPRVVINEIMWMGSVSTASASTADEWIELRNMTDREIDLSNWKVDGAASDASLLIPSGKAIPANGYFLISNYDRADSSSALNVDSNWVTKAVRFNNSYSQNGAVLLKDQEDHLVDQTPPASTSAWPAGVNNDQKRSMERNDSPGDGSQVSSWHSCSDPACNDGIYWKTAEGDNYGTPGSANHSANDPTLPGSELFTQS